MKMTRDDWQDRHLLNSIAATGLLHSKITITNMYRFSVTVGSWFRYLLPWTNHNRQYNYDKGCLTRLSFIAFFTNGWARALGSRWISSAGKQSGFWCHCSEDLFLPVSVDRSRPNDNDLSAWCDCNLPLSISKLYHRDTRIFCNFLTITINLMTQQISKMMQ